MLVLTRKVGEEIVIAGAIRVKVVAMDNHRVRLGIVAPETVTVDREEIYERRNEFGGEESAATGCRRDVPIDR
jgi:carbon storage regulator